MHFAPLDLELIVRIVVGAVIGYERDIHGRPAGLRTHAVVALAASTFMIVSTHFVYYQTYHAGDFVEVDSSRIASTVVSGIGFLAGGAILRNGISVQGLTTAAGLWLVAAIGLCAGGGMYVESVAATVIGVLVLMFLRRFEDKDDRIQRRLELTLADGDVDVTVLIAKLAEQNVMATLDAWRTDTSGEIRHLTLLVRIRRIDGIMQLASYVDGMPEIARSELVAHA